MAAELDDLDLLVETFGMEGVLETLVTVCDNNSIMSDEAGNDDASRKWRVRGNAMRKFANEYVKFCEARSA